MEIAIAFAIALLAIILPLGIPAAITWWELRQSRPRRVMPHEFWDHDCDNDGTRWAVAKGSPCAWCGLTERGSRSTEAAEASAENDATAAATG